MAQQFPTTAQSIYDTLVADATLMGQLGTYEFTAGQLLPAISIVTPGQDLPNVRNIQGIECVIHDAANFDRYEYLSAEPARVSIMWNVFVMSWEPSTGAELQAVSELICSKFLNSSAMQTVAVADGLGATVQNKIVIRSDMPIIA